MKSTRAAAALAAVLLAATPFAPASAGAQEAGPTVTVTPTADLAAGDTVTVSGAGFTAGAGIYVRLCAEAAGEVGTEAGRPGADRCLDEPQHWVTPQPMGTAPMTPDGTFSVTLGVPDTFTGADGEAFDCREVACGIATRRDHMGGAADFSLDTFTPLTFAAAEPEPEPEPAPEPEPEPDPGETPTPAPGPTEPPAPAPAPPADADPTAAPVELTWGIKSSFVRYIEGAGGGTVTVTPPVSRTDDGGFRFGAGDAARWGGVADFEAAFAGSVHFSAHGGVLDVRLSDPRIRVEGSTGTLVVDGTTSDPDTGATTPLDDVVLATLDLTGVQPTAAGRQVTFAGVPAVLTEEGARVFGGFYQPGDALDPLTWVLDVADETGLPPTPAPTPTPTPPQTQAPAPAPAPAPTRSGMRTLPATGSTDGTAHLAVAGAGAVLAGLGVLALRRRLLGSAAPR